MTERERERKLEKGERNTIGREKHRQTERERERDRERETERQRERLFCQGEMRERRKGQND